MEGESARVSSTGSSPSPQRSKRVGWADDVSDNQEDSSHDNIFKVKALFILGAQVNVFVVVCGLNCSVKGRVFQLEEEVWTSLMIKSTVSILSCHLASQSS